MTRTREDEIDSIFENLIETFEQELASNPLPNIHEFARHCPESHRQELIGVLNLMVLMNASVEPDAPPIDLDSPREEHGDGDLGSQPLHAPHRSTA